MNITLTKKSAARLLAAVILARSTSLLFSKLVLTSISTYSLLTFRFLLAFALLAVIFHKRLPEINRTALVCGGILGVLFTAVMSCDIMSLKTCSTSTTSFLENSAIVIVPLLNAAVCRKLPRRIVLLGSVTALSGVAVLALSRLGQSDTAGVLYGLASAMFYSVAILMTGIFSRKADPLLIGIVQVGTIGVCALVLSLVTGTFSAQMPTVNWVYILFLAVVCSCFGFTLQPICQRQVDTDTAGMFCALNPLSCTVLGVLFLHETLSPASLAGCGLILLGILIPHLRLPQRKPARKRKHPAVAFKPLAVRH